MILNEVHSARLEGGAVAGSAYVRVDGDCRATRALVPDLAGANGAHLAVRGAGAPAGPPAGATRYEARWTSRFAAGEADEQVDPDDEEERPELLARAADVPMADEERDPRAEDPEHRSRRADADRPDRTERE